MSDKDALTARIAALEKENVAYERAVLSMARWLSGPIDASTLNEMIRALNTVLPRDKRVNEVAWGVASLEGLQRAVRNLCHIVADPEYAMFLNNRITTAGRLPVPSNGVKRQRLGGVPDV